MRLKRMLRISRVSVLTINNDRTYKVIFPEGHTFSYLYPKSNFIYHAISIILQKGAMHYVIWRDFILTHLMYSDVIDYVKRLDLIYGRA